MHGEVQSVVKGVGTASITANFATASTTYVSTGVTTSVVAEVDDILLCCMSALWSSEATIGRLNLFSVVGGSPVGTAGYGQSDVGGVAAWYSTASRLHSVGVPIPHKVVVADVEGGRVTVGAYQRNDSAATKTLIANAGSAMVLQVINLGPVWNGGLGMPESRLVGYAETLVNLGGDGSLTISSTSYVTGTMEVTVPGSPGDLCLVGGSWLWWTEAVTGYCDVVTRVAGADVSYLSGNGSSGQGIAAWLGFGGLECANGAPQPYRLVAGDIDDGNVLFRLVAKVSSASKQMVAGNAIFWAINLGAVA